MGKQQLFTIFFFSSAFVTLLFFGTKGIVYSDEGYILYSAQRILAGQIPYKDFHFVYTPVSAYLTAVSFLIFGKSILAGRLLMIGIAMGTSFVLYRLLQRFTANKILIFISIALYLSWGSFHIPFPWPVMFSLSLIIIFFYLCLTAIQRKKQSYLVWAGIVIAVMFLTKQNFGFALLASYSVLLYTSQFIRTSKNIIRFTSGFLGVCIVFLVYLLTTGSLIGFWEDFYVYTLKRIVLEQTLTTSFVVGESILYTSLKTLLYLSPLILSLFLVFRYLQTSKKLLFIPVGIGVFYMLGIRPTTDYIHLAPLLALTGILFVLVYESHTSLLIKRGAMVFLGIFCLVGLYSSFFSGFYKWQPPLARNIYWTGIPKTYIFLDDYHKAEIEELKKYIATHTKPSDSIYVYGYMPMLYFVLERENPTKFDLIEPTDFYTQTQKIIGTDIQRNNVPMVITIGIPPKTYLGNSIQKEYTNTKRVNGFYLWEKK